MSYRSIPQECPTRVSHKSVPQECLTRVSYKSVPQECPTRVSHKSFLQECPTRVSYKSVLQECPRRKSHKSVLQECHLDILIFRTRLHSGSWVPSFFFWTFDRRSGAGDQQCLPSGWHVEVQSLPFQCHRVLCLCQPAAPQVHTSEA